MVNIYSRFVSNLKIGLKFQNFPPKNFEIFVPIIVPSQRRWAEILSLVTFNIILAIDMVTRAYLQQQVVEIVVKMGSQNAQFLKDWPELASILSMGCRDMSWL